MFYNFMLRFSPRIFRYLQQALQITSNLITQSTAALYKGVLSFLFSTIIIWDLPYLEKAVKSLKTSRIGFVYRDVAPRYTALYYFS
jgi:hypothetical protein